ncbi:MAG: hypothetical protein K6L81_17580 [Agarilytica sp.]
MDAFFTKIRTLAIKYSEVLVIATVVLFIMVVLYGWWSDCPGTAGIYIYCPSDK